MDAPRRDSDRRGGTGVATAQKEAPADPVEAITQRPPAGLRVEGRRLWRSLAPLPWVGRSDSIALHELCRLADLAQTMRDDIVARGPSYECRGRQYANPSVGMLMEAEKYLTAGLRAFGATPADRGKLGVAEPQPASKFELLQGRRDQRAGRSDAS